MDQLRKGEVNGFYILILSLSHLRYNYLLNSMAANGRLHLPEVIGERIGDYNGAYI